METFTREKFTRRQEVFLWVLIVAMLGIMLQIWTGCSGTGAAVPEAEAAEVGFPLAQQIPNHGHGGVTDGGTLSVVGVLVHVSPGYPPNLAGGGGGPMSFNAELYDTHNIHDNVTNNTRFTIPQGYNYASVDCQTRADTTISPNRATLQLRKNGGLFTPSIASSAAYSVTNFVSFELHTPPMPVVPGDYLEVWLTNDGTGTMSFSGDRTWCQVSLYR